MSITFGTTIATAICPGVFSSPSSEDSAIAPAPDGLEVGVCVVLSGSTSDSDRSRSR